MAVTELFDDRRRAVMIAAAQRWQQQPLTPGVAAPADRARFDARRASLETAQELKVQGRLPVFIERKIGPTLDWYTAPPTETARTAGRPVARIVPMLIPRSTHLASQPAS